MLFKLICLCLVAGAVCQSNPKDLKSVLEMIFGKNNSTLETSTVLSDAVSSEPDDEENSSCITSEDRAGVCVPYYLCDVKSGVVNKYGLGVIDNRHQRKRSSRQTEQIRGCRSSYLYVCCLLPPQPEPEILSTPPTANLTLSTVEDREPGVVTSKPEASPTVLSTLDADDRIQNGNSCILPHYPAHGTYTTNIPGAEPGAAVNIVAVNITCREGYVLNGASLVYCFSGQWTTDMIPQCVLPCRVTPHPSVKFRCVVSVKGVYGFRDCTEYEPSGTWAKPFCRTHYYPTNTLTFMECENGRWTNNVQKCTPDCGILTPNSKQLILNGTVAKLGEVPWHAAIYRKSEGSHILICGGSLVSTSIVITAAHCFWDTLVGQLPASDYVVAVGKLYRGYGSNMEDNTYKPQWSTVESIQVPDRFRGRLTNFQDDIAVMRLSAMIEYDTHIRPVCVDFDQRFEQTQLRPGNKGKVAGWGLTTELGKPARELRVVELPYVSVDTCFKSVPVSFYADITSDKICAGYDDAGTAVCRGDSGGGLAFPALDRGTPRYYLRGVVSTAPAAPAEGDECNADTYTTFTRLIKHEDFITRFWSD